MVIEKLKEIERLMCENSEELDYDNVVEEGYYDKYLEIKGATDEEIEAFEKHFNIILPDNLKTIYKYKNGSGLMPLFLPNDEHKRQFWYDLIPLEKIIEKKGYFQARDALLTEFDDYFSESDIEDMKDDRIKPYLFNTKWIPFAYGSGIYLMLDFDPADKGKMGQIICYIHDPDEIIYVAEDITQVIDETIKNLTI